MSSTPIRPPSTLHELNEALARSIQSGSFEPLSFLGTDGKPSFEKFCNEVLAQLKVYKDRNEEAELNLLQKQVVQLYPINQETKNLYPLFSKAIKELKNPPKGVISPSEHQARLNAMALKAQGHEVYIGNHSISDVIKITQIHVSRDPLERLQDIYEMGKSDEIKTLKVILNLLYSERRFVEAVFHSFQVFVHRAEAYKRYIKGAEKIVKISPLKEIPIFEIPESVKSSEEFAFRLQLGAILQDAPHKIRQMIKSSDAKSFDSFLRVYQGYIDLLKSANPDIENWGHLIHRVLAYIESELSYAQLRVNINNLKDTLNNYLNSPLVKSHKSLINNIEDVTSPYFSLLLGNLRDQIVKDLEIQGKGENSDAVDTDYYQNRGRFCLAYRNVNAHQAALYHTAYQRLKTLSLSLKSDRERIQCFNNTGIHSTSLRVLPETLGELHFPKFDPLVSFRETFLKQSLVQDSKEEEREEPVQVAVPQPQKKSSKKSKKQASAPRELEPPAIVEKLAPIKPFIYAERVERWFNKEPRKPLDPKIFWEYEGCSESYGKLMENLHGFSLAADTYYDIGTTGIWKNPTTGNDDFQYIIPAEMEVEGRKERGVIVYCIGNGLCYHRFFSNYVDDQLIDKIVRNAFKEADFPELAKAVKFKESDLVAKPSEHPCADEVTIHPLLGTITIKDHRLGLILRLFRAKPAGF